MSEHEDEDSLPRVFIEHDEPVTSGAVMSESERAFRRWLEQRALDDEPERPPLDDE